SLPQGAPAHAVSRLSPYGVRHWRGGGRLAVPSDRLPARRARGPPSCPARAAGWSLGVRGPWVRPPFSTRARLTVIALRRWWSLSPEASRGGRPSSVRALRTAAQ